MTLTLELPREVEARLQAGAEAAGVALTYYARDVLSRGTAEDLADLEHAQRVLANSDPAQRRTLDDLRRHLGRLVTGTAV